MAPHHQALYKTVNKVGKVVSSVGAYTVCTYIHVYNAVLHMQCVHILCMHKHKKHLCQDHKINTNLLKHVSYYTYCQV